jgi:translation initiation factor 4E
MTTATGVTVVEQQKPVESKATTADNTASTGEARGSVSKIVAEQPLHNKWVLWYDNPKAALPNTDWRENLQFCGRFDTPAKFWQIFNNVKPPSQIGDKCNYHIFKEGIEPMWEDPKNENGGKWVLTITKTSNNKSRVDEFWLFTCLAVIGETIDFAGDMVCGAVVSIRRNQDRIALWIKTDEPNIVSQIGARWKKAMDVPNRLKYQVHRDGKFIKKSVVLFELIIFR